MAGTAMRMSQEQMNATITPGELRILDVGAGPLSASAGALVALGAPVRIHAIDRAEQMMQLGKRALHALPGGSETQVVLETADVRAAIARMRRFAPWLTVLGN